MNLRRMWRLYTACLPLIEGSILRSSVKDQGYEKALIKMKKKVKTSADKFY